MPLFLLRLPRPENAPVQLTEEIAKIKKSMCKYLGQENVQFPPPALLLLYPDHLYMAPLESIPEEGDRAILESLAAGIAEVETTIPAAIIFNRMISFLENWKDADSMRLVQIWRLQGMDENGNTLSESIPILHADERIALGEPVREDLFTEPALGYLQGSLKRLLREKTS